MLKDMNLVLTNKGLVSEPEYLKISFPPEHSVYEVMRIIDGVALFPEDHFRRLVKSAGLQGLSFQMPYPEFKQNITALVLRNNLTAGNVKFVYFLQDGNACWAYLIIPHSYPTSAEYSQGVSAGLLLAERRNPNAKVIQSKIRNKADLMTSGQDLYEVLLVDANGLITEGSRSNVFFVKADVFYTAPASLVLEGITRQKVIRCLDMLDLKLVEQAVPENEISDFDAAFLTGTSPKVLPIRSIGEQLFDVQNQVVKRLMDCYDQMVREYIAGEKTKGNNAAEAEL